MLHALQKGKVEAVGGRKSVKVDVRIISATNRDLIVDAKSGRFREDLFYRLHVCLLSVPPLRARREDIPELACHFLTRIAAEEGKRVRSIRTEAQALLAANHWPSNVHQLENAIFRAVVLADGDVIGAGEFRQVAAQVSSKATSIQPAVEPSPALAVSWPEPDTTTGTETPEVMAERHSVPLTDP